MITGPQSIESIKRQLACVTSISMRLKDEIDRLASSGDLDDHETLAKIGAQVFGKQDREYRECISLINIVHTEKRRTK